MKTAVLTLFVGLFGTVAAWATELVMVEQVGCGYCKKWHAEIGPAYPKTAEGAFAPLRRVDIRDVPEDLDLERRVNFTPTFVLVEDGDEIARLEGYPGEDFFWPLLAKMLQQNTRFGEARSDTPPQPLEGG